MALRTLALLSVVLLTSCEHQQTADVARVTQAKQPLRKVGPLSVPPSLTGLELCSNQFPHRMVVKTVARILIPANLTEMADREIRVRYAASTVTGDDEDIYLNHSTPLDLTNIKDSRFAENPFHLETSSISLLNDETHLEVHVILQSEKLKFLVDAGGHKLPIQGIAYQDGQGGKDWLCQQAHPITSPQQAGKSIMTFFVRRQSPGSPNEASINFLIGTRDSKWGAETPILIDPRIKNDG